MFLLICSLTEAQMKIVDKYDKLAEKDIADSHFFHTDTSGSKYPFKVDFLPLSGGPVYYKF